MGTYGPTNRRTDQRTDAVSYRGATSLLKIKSLMHFWKLFSLEIVWRNPESSTTFRLEAISVWSEVVKKEIAKQCFFQNDLKIDTFLQTLLQTLSLIMGIFKKSPISIFSGRFRKWPYFSNSLKNLAHRTEKLKN